MKAERHNTTRTARSRSKTQTRVKSTTARRSRRTKLDPIFEVIGVHQEAAAEFSRALDVLGAAETRRQNASKAELEKANRAVAAAEAEEKKASVAEGTAFKKLCCTTPTTPLGLITWIGYLRERMTEI